jgi:hypothetical protein
MKIDSPNALGTSTGFGIPTGGTTNQILSKVDGTNYNTQWVDNVTPIYIQAGNSSGQLMPSGSNNITGWTTNVNTVPGGWDTTNGIFTCPRASWYSVSISIIYDQNTSSINTEFNIGIAINGSVNATGVTFKETGNNVFVAVQPTQTIRYLNVGDTVRFVSYNNGTTGMKLWSRADINIMAIQELPSRIVR